MPAAAKRSAAGEADATWTEQREPTSEEFLALASASYDAYYAFDQNKGYNAFGPQLDVMLGLPPYGLERQYYTAIERIHPDDRERVDRLVDESFASGQPYVDRYRMRREDGSYIHISDRGVIIPAEGDRPARMIGMFRDITPEITAERLERESEELYTSLFRRVGNPLLQLDRHGVCTDANSAAERFLEEPREGLSGRMIDDILSTPSGSVGRLLTTEADIVPPLEEVNVTVNGATKIALITVVPCEFRGEDVYFLMATDITQLRNMSELLARSEARLREQATALEARNTTLAVLLEQRQQERRELEQEVTRNVQRFLLPVVERLREATGSRPEHVHVDMLWDTMSDILKPVASRIDAAVSPSARLTRREAEILNMVRFGRTTKEIATALFLSPTTVAAHRRSIRRKLGLRGDHTHLSTYLGTVDTEE